MPAAVPAPVARAAAGLLVALPAVLTVVLAFRSGGFFAGAPAAVAVLLAAVLAVRALLARAPFAGLGVAVVVPAVALTLLGAWTLLSIGWSQAPGRALVELGRVLAYTLALVLFGSLAREPGRLRLLVRLTAAGLVAVAVCALVTRLLPEVWPTDPTLAPERLAYPVSYWNGLGILAGLALLLCVHLTADEREPGAVRALAAGAVPLVAATLLFTFSRGALAATLVGLVAYLVVARPRGAVTALLAAGPPTAIVLVTTYAAEAVTGTDPTAPAAVAEGRDVAVVVGLCALAAVLVRALLVPVDARVRRLRAPAPRTQLVAIGLVAVAVLAGGLALGGAGAIERQANRFAEQDTVPADDADLRSRLTSASNNGRLMHWEAALADFEADPWRGAGAGTFQLAWERDRPVLFAVVDAHSLYVEAAGELGIVGLALVVLAVLSILAGLALRARGPDRPLFAALLAAWLAWALHAGIDWDWELTAVSLWLFALAGAALARPAAAGGDEVAPRPTPLALRGAVAAGCVALAVVPALVALSQDHLDRGVRALMAGDCRSGAREAIEAIDLLSGRSQPWELLGYCQLRLGAPREAVRSLEAAARRDPNSWEPRYGLALAQAAAGADPRPALRRARRMNPEEPLVDQATRTLGRARGRDRAVRALGLPLPVQTGQPGPR